MWYLPSLTCVHVRACTCVCMCVCTYVVGKYKDAFINCSQPFNPTPIRREANSASCPFAVIYFWHCVIRDSRFMQRVLRYIYRMSTGIQYERYLPNWQKLMNPVKCILFHLLITY